MRLSRIDFVPLLTIMAGGVLGASLSISLLGSRSDNVSAPLPVVAPSPSVAIAALLVSAPNDGVARVDLAGDWLVDVGAQTPGSAIILRLLITIEQDGQAITVSGVAGNSGAFAMTGSIEESAVQILWEADFGSGPREFRFTGTTTENGMSGSVEVDTGQTVTESDWTATRR